MDRLLRMQTTSVNPERLADVPDGCRGNGIPLPEIQKVEPFGGEVWREVHSPREVQEGTACGGVQRGNSLAG